MLPWLVFQFSVVPYRVLIVATKTIKALVLRCGSPLSISHYVVPMDASGVHSNFEGRVRKLCWGGGSVSGPESAAPKIALNLPQRVLFFGFFSSLRPKWQFERAGEFDCHFKSAPGAFQSHSLSSESFSHSTAQPGATAVAAFKISEPWLELSWK